MISQPLLSQYCHAERSPTRKRLRILAKVLEVNEDWLAGFDVDRNSGVEIDSLPLASDAEIELPVKDLFRVLGILGFSVDRAGKGHSIKKGSVESFVYAEEELLCKYHLLANYCKFLVQTDMYFEKEDLIKTAYKDML